MLRLILQCGTSEQEFRETVGDGVEALEAIANETKGHKYILKQLSEWKRLQRGELSEVEAALRSKYLTLPVQ